MLASSRDKLEQKVLFRPALNWSLWSTFNIAEGATQELPVWEFASLILSGLVVLLEGGATPFVWLVLVRGT